MSGRERTRKRSCKQVLPSPPALGQQPVRPTPDTYTGKQLLPSPRKDERAHPSSDSTASVDEFLTDSKIENSNNSSKNTAFGSSGRRSSNEDLKIRGHSRGRSKIHQQDFSKDPSTEVEQKGSSPCNLQGVVKAMSKSTFMIRTWKLVQHHPRIPV